MFRPFLLGGTHPMPFKVKINVLLLLAILVTIGTAWFSVNHYISGYIRTQATQNINEQITLVKPSFRSQFQN